MISGFDAFSTVCNAKSFDGEYTVDLAVIASNVLGWVKWEQPNAGGSGTVWLAVEFNGACYADVDDRDNDAWVTSINCQIYQTEPAYPGDPAASPAGNYAFSGFDKLGGTVNEDQTDCVGAPQHPCSATVSYESTDDGQQYSVPEECLECCGKPKNVPDDQHVSRELRTTDFTSLQIQSQPEGGGAWTTIYVQDVEKVVKPYRFSDNTQSACTLSIPVVKSDDANYKGKVGIELPPSGFWCMSEISGSLNIPLLRPLPANNEESGTIEFNEVASLGDGNVYRAFVTIAARDESDDCQDVLCCGSRYRPPSGSVCPVADWIIYSLADDNQLPGQPRQRVVWMKPDPGQPGYSIDNCVWELPALDINDVPIDPVRVELVYGPLDTGSLVFEARDPTVPDPGIVLVGDGDGIYCGTGGVGGPNNKRFDVEATISGIERCDPQTEVCAPWGSNRGHDDVYLKPGAQAVVDLDLDAMTSNPGYSGRVQFTAEFVGEAYLEGDAGSYLNESPSCQVWDTPPVDANQVVPPPVPGPQKPHHGAVAFSFEEHPTTFEPIWYITLSFTTNQQSYCQVLPIVNSEQFTGAGNQPPSSGTWELRDPSDYNTVIGSVTITGTEDGCPHECDGCSFKADNVSGGSYLAFNGDTRTQVGVGSTEITCSDPGTGTTDIVFQGPGGLLDQFQVVIWKDGGKWYAREYQNGSTSGGYWELTSSDCSGTLTLLDQSGFGFGDLTVTIAGTGAAASAAAARSRAPQAFDRSKFGDRFFIDYPSMNRGSGCSGCDDVRMLMNSYDIAAVEDHVDRWAAEVHRITGKPLDNILAAIRSTAATLQQERDH